MDLLPKQYQVGYISIYIYIYNLLHLQSQELWHHEQHPDTRGITIYHQETIQRNRSKSTQPSTMLLEEIQEEHSLSPQNYENILISNISKEPRGKMYIQSSETSKPAPRHTSFNKATPPTPSQTILPTGVQIFKHMSRWGSFSFKPT